MSILIFIIILGVLIFVHELGHFLVAKAGKIRVDEFAVGFPPKIWSWTKNGTKYALNLIPIGGYVKIFGESADEESLDPENKDSFLNKSRWIQAAVLVAGVVFNVVFAWMLFSVGFMFGTLALDDGTGTVSDTAVYITDVLPDSPALNAEFLAGDKILSISRGEDLLLGDDLTVNSVQEFISDSEENITLEVQRGNEIINLQVFPETDIVGEQRAIGVSLGSVGIQKLPIHLAIKEGFFKTYYVIKATAKGLGALLKQTFKGNGSLDNVAGPVGIVKLVGDAASFGFINILDFTALISINLAIINILPFPALDGGRLLIVLIEGVTRRRIKSSIVNAINAIGFAILLILMFLITFNDVVNLL